MSGKAGMVIAAFAAALMVAGCVSEKSSMTSGSAPKIDGDLSDACWKSAEVKGAWIDVYTGRAPAVATQAFITHDKDNVYVAFRNAEPMTRRLVAQCVDRDGNVWLDDANELFLDPSAGKRDYYQFIVNSKGTLYDGHGRDPSWNSHAVVAAKVTADGYVVEMAIPLKDLGVTGSPAGQMWRGNFCRNRQVTGSAEAFAWSDTGESFHNPDAFGKLMMK